MHVDHQVNVHPTPPITLPVRPIGNNRGCGPFGQATVQIADRTAAQ
jgi:hypothetical protein